MGHVPAAIGIRTADAEQVEVHLVQGSLRLTYIDWQQRPREHVFEDVLGFRWQEFDERDPAIRDDTAYEVLDSAWLIRQAAPFRALPPN